MPYRIELSFDMRKSRNVSEIKADVKKLAEEYACEFIYEDCEMWGHGRTINRTHFVMTLEFPEDETNVIAFIRKLKKKSGIYIELVGFDNCIFDIIYASKKYLNFMDKYKAKDYLKQKNNLSIGKYKQIIKVIKSK